MRGSDILLHSLALVLFLLVGVTGEAAEPVYRIFVGTYTAKGSKGIYSFRFDSRTGKASAAELAGETKDPSYLAVDRQGHYLYATNEILEFQGKQEGSISVFAIDGSKLTAVQQVSSVGAGPVYLQIDRTGKNLLVANYGDGSVADLPVGSDGRLKDATAFVRHSGSSVNRERQAGPHAHAIQLSNDEKYAASCDLGLDKILIYRFNAEKGSLTAPGEAKVAPGSGARHLVFAPNGKFVYVANELLSTITVFAYAPESGAMREVETISSLAPETPAKSSAAEIAMDAKGRYVYVSNRGDDSITQFAVDRATGRLTYLARTSTGGRTPRFFAFDPTGRWLWVANQDSDDLVLFKVGDKGALSSTDVKVEIGSPVSLVFVRVGDAGR
jgi:6-phosphogluconolactonase